MCGVARNSISPGGESTSDWLHEVGVGLLIEGERSHSVGDKVDSMNREGAVAVSFLTALHVSPGTFVVTDHSARGLSKETSSVAPLLEIRITFLEPEMVDRSPFELFASLFESVFVFLLDLGVGEDVAPIVLREVVVEAMIGSGDSSLGMSTEGEGRGSPGIDDQIRVVSEEDGSATERSSSLDY